MQSKSYALVLAKYVQRFESQPPSILTNAAAAELMIVALRRGAPISEHDLLPVGPAEAGEDTGASHEWHVHYRWICGKGS